MNEATRPTDPAVDTAPGLPDDEFSSLLQSINAAAPLLHGVSGALSGKRSEGFLVREKFLLSLKPYLSKTRCEAIDYLLRIARLSDVLHTLL